VTALALAFVITGAAWIEQPRPALVTWGDRLQVWPENGGRPTDLIPRAQAGLGPGGCTADVDGDSRDDLILQERPGLSRMVWLRAPHWERATIEPETWFQDCLATTLDGRRGVLVLHRNTQLRFYAFAPGFPYRELYAVYTPSEQGGLLLRDIDGDGRDDSLFGNYWLRRPSPPETHWRLFAINTYSEGPLTALAALAWFRDGLVWAEATAAANARVMHFRPRADVHEQWEPQPLGDDIHWAHPRGVATSSKAIYIGEDNGPRSRLYELRPNARPRLLDRGRPVVRLFVRGQWLWVAGGDGVRRHRLRD
jgi:hypothetical protein